MEYDRTDWQAPRAAWLAALVIFLCAYFQSEWLAVGAFACLLAGCIAQVVKA